MGCSKSSSKRKFIAIEAYLKKKEKSQINNITLHLKELEKEQSKPKVSRRNYNDQSRNKWNRNKENNSKDQ